MANPIIKYEHIEPDEYTFDIKPSQTIYMHVGEDKDIVLHEKKGFDFSIYKKAKLNTKIVQIKDLPNGRPEMWKPTYANSNEIDIFREIGEHETGVSAMGQYNSSTVVSVFGVLRPEKDKIIFNLNYGSWGDEFTHVEAVVAFDWSGTMTLKKW